MTVDEIVKKLKDGKKLQSKSWNSDLYLIYDSCYNNFYVLKEGSLFKKRVLTARELLTHEWVEYEEGHDFTWAILQLKKGKKISRRGWKFKSSYFFYRGEELWLSSGPKNNCIQCPAVVMASDLNANDWFISGY